MGYKLAGFDVIGFNEIDPRMANLYVKNHEPKYQFVEAMQDFVRWDEYPEELYHLDILDGSPPCTSFSMAGKREANWGVEKFFKEGQKKQVLDTLFFDFIALAEKLQPKIVIAENVKGILQGKAKAYTKRILSEFDKAGYKVNYYLLDASKMGVPQRRERVFFVAIRKDLADKVSDLRLNFDLPAISFGAIKYNENTASWTAHDQNVWQNRKHGDRNYADVLKRIENRDSNFNAQFIYDDKTPPTLAASSGSKMVLFSEARKMNHTELIRCQSFPQDYDFRTSAYSFVQYVLGMSVPPVMMANLAYEIYTQWKEIFH